MGPGGLYDDNQVNGVNCIGGAAGYIDRKFFGTSHIYSNPTAKSVYGGPERDLIGPYDPEGFLGIFSLVNFFKEILLIYLFYRMPYFCCSSVFGIPSRANFDDL